LGTNYQVVDVPRDEDSPASALVVELVARVAASPAVLAAPGVLDALGVPDALAVPAVPEGLAGRAAFVKRAARAEPDVPEVVAELGVAEGAFRARWDALAVPASRAALAAFVKRAALAGLAVPVALDVPVAPGAFPVDAFPVDWRA
jgi:hypothetical protein